MPEPEPLRWNMTLPNGQPLRYGTPGARWGGTVAEVMAALAPTTNPSMPQNLISATLAEQLADDLIADIASLKAKQVAFLLALSAEEKQDVAKMGTGNLALEGIIRTAATENPGELAANFPLAAWDQDRAFAATYAPVVSAMAKAFSDMEDTLLAARSDAWTVAMEAYGDLKKDGVGPAIDEARAIMRARHRRRTPPASPNPPTP